MRPFLLGLVSWAWVPTVCLTLSLNSNRSSDRDGLVLPSQLLLGLVALLQGSHSYAWSSFRNVECLNLLLSSGADLRRRDKFGRQVPVQGAQGWHLVGESGGRKSVLPCTLLFRVWACYICP